MLHNFQAPLEEKKKSSPSFFYRQKTICSLHQQKAENIK